MADTDDDALVPPPDNLPRYVIGPLTRQSPGRLRAAADWARELADAKENAEPDTDTLGNDSEEIVDREERDDGPTVVVKKVPCGKDNCSSCPHGPYRYHVTHEDGSVSWEYRGAVDDGEV
jgi:hypothetical protein